MAKCIHGTSIYGENTQRSEGIFCSTCRYVSGSYWKHQLSSTVTTLAKVVSFRQLTREIKNNILGQTTTIWRPFQNRGFSNVLDSVTVVSLSVLLHKKATSKQTKAIGVKVITFTFTESFLEKKSSYLTWKTKMSEYINRPWKTQKHL
jgi:hypothetical protein